MKFLKDKVFNEMIGKVITMQQVKEFLENEKRALEERIAKAATEGWNITKSYTELEYLRKIMYKWQKIEENNLVYDNEPIEDIEEDY